MCVAITMEPGAELSLDEIIKMGRTNGDGIGVAWAEDGVVNWTKAVNYMPHQAYNFINSYKDYFRLVHFRLSTAGGVLSQLCHPFEIGPFASCAQSGHGTKALIHNGHWYRWTDVFDILKKEDALPDKGPWSDSRLMAYLAHHDPDWLLTVGGRVAVMDGQGNTTRYGDWQDLRPGIKVSNKSWDHSYNYTRRGKDRDWPGWGWTEEHWQQKEAHEADLARQAKEKEAKEKEEKNGQAKEQASKASEKVGEKDEAGQKGQGQIQEGQKAQVQGQLGGGAAHLSVGSVGGGSQHVRSASSTSGGSTGSSDKRGDAAGTGDGVYRSSGTQSYFYSHPTKQSTKGVYTVPGTSPVTFDHNPWQNPTSGRWFWIPPSSVDGRQCRVEEISADFARKLMVEASTAASSGGNGQNRGN
jgi:hypothetical protein